MSARPHRFYTEADPNAARRQGELAALQLTSPKRAESGRVIAPQHNTADLPLFAAADQLSLF